jgi:hypothetical protein
MKRLELRYVAHITTLTNRWMEQVQSQATSLRELVTELDDRFPGFVATFIDAQTGRLTWNTMIYYSNPGEVPISVTDLDQPICDGAVITFW